MTGRQQAILEAIIELYARTAEPVGSQALVERFDMSSATIRAEMAALENGGYIMQPHISAGRVPTDKGYRAYVNQMGEANSSASDRGRVSQALAKRIKSAGEIDRAIKQAAESLAEITQNVGLATLSEGLFFTGLASLFNQPEFGLSGRAYEMARLIDNLDEWLSEAAPQDRVSVFIGNENPIGRASEASLIIARFQSPYSDRSYVGVLGPTRQRYHEVIGLVDYTGKLLEEALGE